jgi:hypothetical protein
MALVEVQADFGNGQIIFATFCAITLAVYGKRPASHSRIEYALHSKSPESFFIF